MNKYDVCVLVFSLTYIVSWFLVLFYSVMPLFSVKLQNLTLLTVVEVNCFFFFGVIVLFACFVMLVITVLEH